jgi:F0F1-type ATP synthase delta subunit
MIKLSRQQIAKYAAEQLLAGNRKVINEVAAYLIDVKKDDQVDLLVRDIELYLSRVGHLLAYVGSVHELTIETKKAITSLLKKQTGAAHIDLSEYRDISLVGGIKIDIPGAQLDTSIARTLATLKN